MNNTRSDFLVYMQLLLAMLFFGLSFVFTSFALNSLRPISLVLLRLSVSVPTLVLLSRLRPIERIVGVLQRPTRSEMPLLLLIALFQPFGYFLAENTGLLYASPAVASIVIGTIPVATPIFAWLLIRERVRVPTVIGAILSFSGVVFLVLADAESTAANPIGVVLVFGAVLSAVGYSIVLRRLPGYFSAISVVFWQNLLGMLMFLPLFLVFDMGHFAQVLTRRGASGELVAAVMFLGIFPSTLSFIFLSRGIRTLGATRANVTANLVPVFASLFSVLVLGERIGAVTVLGMLIVISGVLLSQMTRLRRGALARW